LVLWYIAFPLYLNLKKKTPYASIHYSAGKTVSGGEKEEKKTVDEKKQTSEG